MRTWSTKSAAVAITLDKTLLKVVTRIRDEVADISLLEGHRGQKKQNEYFYGQPQRSKLPWPKGKHNKYPSLAVDLQPYPRPERTGVLRETLAYIAGAATAIGREEGVTIRWGGDWDRDSQLGDQNFDDFFHLEVVLNETDHNDGSSNTAGDTGKGE